MAREPLGRAFCAKARCWPAWVSRSATLWVWLKQAERFQGGQRALVAAGDDDILVYHGTRRCFAMA